MHETPPATGDQKSIVGVFRTVDRVLTVLDNGVIFVACICIFGTMMVVATDAIGRYAFNHPLVFTNDLVSMYLLPACLLLPLAFTLRRGGHIAVDLFAMLMPRRCYLVVIGIALLASVPLISLMAYQMGVRTYESWAAGMATFGLYSFPVWLGEIIVTVSLVSMAVRLLQLAVANLTAGITGEFGFAVAITPEHEDPLEEGI